LKLLVLQKNNFVAFDHCFSNHQKCKQHRTRNCDVVAAETEAGVMMVVVVVVVVMMIANIFAPSVELGRLQVCDFHQAHKLPFSCSTHAAFLSS